MSMLGYYCRRATETRGLEHKATITNLRVYLKLTPIDSLIIAINLISNLDYLRALWEAGMIMELQQAVLRRHDELTTRRQT